MKAGKLFLSLMVLIITFFAVESLINKAQAMGNVNNAAIEENHSDPEDAEPVHPQNTKDDLTTDPNAKMVFDKVVHDFGDVAPNSKSTCEFKFTNEGTAVLKVNKKIGSTCGCTVPTLPKGEYLPGESGIITVAYTANSRPGLVEKHMTVYSNSSTGGNTTLAIKATTVEKISFEPSRLNLAYNKENAGCPNITVKSKDGTEFSITRVTAPENAVFAEFDPEEKNSEFVIQPKVDMEKIKKFPNGLLTIFLKHPQMDKIDVPYSLLTPFKSEPATIIALNAKSSVPINRTVYILSNYDEPFEIQSIEISEPFVKVVKKEKLDNNRYQIDFEITPPVQTGKRHFSGMATINLENDQNLTINIIGSIGK